MHEPIRFILNGTAVETNCRADRTVLEWLRGDARLTGTKEGCAEGDCSACSVLIHRPDVPEPQPVNACILTMGQIAGAAITTVEGLAAMGDGGNAVQRAMAANGSSQCGFCTPGIVVALSALASRNDAPDEDDVHEAMAGNLCRCTGYRPIVEAALASARNSEPITAPTDWPRTGAASGSPDSRYLRPGSLTDLVEARQANPDAPLLAGGTDLGLAVAHARVRWPVAILTRDVPELRAIKETDETLEIGAAVTWDEILPHADRHWPSFATLIRRFGSAQVRSVATMGGNLGTASPIGDTAPTLLAIGASLRVAGPSGERTVPLAGHFLGYRVTTLATDEIIRSIIMPKPSAGEALHVWKVSKRYDQDISTICGAFSVRVEDGHVSRARTGWGGVAAIPTTAPALDEALTGAGVDDLEAAATLAEGLFSPLSDMRSTARYRARIVGNLVRRLSLELQGHGDHVTSIEATLPEAAE